MGLGGGGSGDLEIKVVAQGIDTVSKQIEDLDKKLSGVGKTSDSATSGIGGLSSGLIAAGVGALSFGAAMSALTSSLDNALRVENLTAGFNNLQQSIGKDSVASMEALQQSTDGLISKMDLMQSANQAVLLGVDDGSGKFEKLSGAALKLGNAMGITAKEALDSLVVGIGRGSKLVLDNLGVVVDTELAYKNFAKTIGTTVDKLDDSEKKLAFQQAAFAAVEEKANSLSGANDTAATAYQRFKVAVSDATDQITTSISSSDYLKQAIEGLTLAVKQTPSALESFTGWLIEMDKAAVKGGASLIKWILEPFEQIARFSFSQTVQTLSQIRDLANFQLPDSEKGAALAQKGLDALDRKLAQIRGKTLDLPSDVTKINASFEAMGQDAFKLDANLTGLSDSTIKANSSFGGLTLDLNKTSRALSGGGNAGGKSVEDAAKKAKSALESLKDSVTGSAFKNSIKSLTDDLLKAETKGDSALATSLRTQIKEALNKGYKDSFLGKGGQLSGEAAGLISQQSQQEIDKIEKDLAEGLKKAHKEGTDFWSGLMEDAITQSRFSWEDQLKKGSVTILSDFLAGFTDVTSLLKGSFEGLGGNLKTVFGELIKGTEASMDTMLGAAQAAAPAIGATLAAGIAQGAATDVLAGKPINKRDGTTIAASDPSGISAAAVFSYNALVGGSKSAGEKARDQIEAFLEETLGKDVVFDTFTNNFSGAFSEITGEAQGAFETIGSYITDLVGVTEDVGAQIGYILSDNFGGTIDDLKYVVSDLGITFEQVQESMVQAFLAGEQSASQVVSALAGIEEAFKPGLAGAGMFTQAMDNLIGSMGQGAESLKSLKDLAVEFKETGGKTLGEFQVALENSGKYTSAQISTLFQALANKGITSLDQLAGASDITLIGIISDLESLGFQFSDSIGQGVKDSIKDIDKLRETLGKLPDTIEKNLKIKVSTEYSDSSAKGALNQLTNSGPGLARA